MLFLYRENEMELKRGHSGDENTHMKRSASKALVIAAVCVAGWVGRTSGIEFHVAANGRDANDGSAAKPFATVEKAMAALREFRASNTSETVRVALGEGTFQLCAPIILTDRETAAPVVFAGNGADKTILSGGRRINPDVWRVGGDGRSWTTTLEGVSNGAWRVQQAYVAGRRALRPALPRDGYFLAEDKPADVPKPVPDRLVAAAGDLDDCWDDLTNGVEFVAMHGWNITRTRVKAFDRVTRQVALAAGRAGYMRGFGPDSYYRLENVKSAYGEAEGEWYCDARTGLLSYLPLPGETPANAPFVVPVLANLVTVQGDRAAGRKAANVSFQSLGFEHAAEPLAEPGTTYHQTSLEAGAAIAVDYADNVTIDACAVRHTGGWAVKIEGGCVGCAVTGSTFFDLGAGGVALGVKGARRGDAKQHTHDCRVERCLVEGGGRVQAGAVGVCVAMAGGNRIAHNTIRDFYYSGISVGYDWSDKNDAAAGNIVEWNHIYDIGQRVLSDLGGIYTLGRQPGTVLRCNLIHDIRTARYGAQGVYMDQGSAEILACSNIITRADEAAFSVAPGACGGIRFENNIFLFPRRYIVWTFPENRKGSDVTVARNVFVWDDKLKGMFPDGGPAKEWRFSSNVWWQAAWPERIHFRERGGTNAFVLADAPAGSRWKQWHKLAVPSPDVGAWLAAAPGDTVEDPRLGAAYGDERHLKPWPDSPAVARGFVPFDLSAGAGHEPKEQPYARTLPSVCATRTFPAAPLARKAQAALAEEAAKGELRMTVFNQRYILGGAGMGVAFRTPAGKTFFFDMGNGDDAVVAHNCGRDTIDPWLYANGIRKIDGVVASHAHGDHFGGLLALWNRYPVDYFWDNDYRMPGQAVNGRNFGELDALQRLRALLTSANPHLVCRGVRQFDKLDWDPALDVTVITPPKAGIPFLVNPNRMKNDGPEHNLINANALGIRVEYGKISYQIIGDIQEDYEEAFLLPTLPAKFKTCDILVPCSHGIHATGVEASVFHPKVAIGTVYADGAADGWSRTWAFTLPVWNVYRNVGAEVYVSGADGDVTASSDGKTWRVTTEFGANRRADPFLRPARR